MLFRSSLGAASGIVAGLVAITPACSSVNVVGALAVGVVSGALCALAVGLKFRFGFDDALDVVGVHLVGGLTGTILIGFFGFDHGALAGGVEAKRGLFYGGGLTLLWVQIIAAASVFAYSFVVTFVIGSGLKALGLFRVSAEAEQVGLDESQHAETAYAFSTLSGGTLTHPSGGAEAAADPAVMSGQGV